MRQDCPEPVTESDNTMAFVSPKQRELIERDALILEVAREMLLERGYFGLTMDRLAHSSNCPKGTMYQRFGCKEDVILALALQSLESRSAMVERAATFDGKTRERVLALGEAVALFERLHPDESRILHTATGPIREKASIERVAALREEEHAAVGMLCTLLQEAVDKKELLLDREGATVEEMTYATWALVEGSLTLIESGVPKNTLGIEDPFTRMFRAFNVLADGYGWHPLFHEWDWEETLARVRKTVFPEEAQAVYGAGIWYGDRA